MSDATADSARTDIPKRTRGSALLHDALAGLTVAVVELPQAMAYAVIAGVSPVYGIYTSVVQGFIGSLLCANRHVRTGPTNTQSLLAASVMANLGQLSGEQYVLLLAAMTLLKGLLQIIAGSLRAGALFRFVSPSAIVGIGAGAGVLIIAGQLPALIGMVPGSTHGLPGLSGSIAAMLGATVATEWHAMAIGIGTVAVMIGLSRIHRLVPAALIAVAASCALVAAFGWQQDFVKTVGPIPHALPALVWPLGIVEPTQWSSLIAGAAALAVLGMVEAVAIGRTLSDANDVRSGASSANRELVAQGVANFASSFIAAIPGSASFSRSMLDRAAGARTRASGPIGAVAVLLLALAIAPAGKYLPYATLAGILVVIAAKLIDVSYFAQLYRHHRADFAVCLVTALATVLLPLQYAVFAGVGLNLLLQLLVASRLRAYELVPTREGGFRESTIDEPTCGRPIRVLQLDGNLFFALSDGVESLLRQLERSPARVVILRLRNTHAIDASVADSIVAFAKRMRAADRHVLLCGLRGHTLATLEARFARIPGGSSNALFASNDELLHSLGNAMAEARRLIGEPPVARRDEDAWVYVI